MIIEICSIKKALELAAAAREKTAVISITSLDDRDVEFPGNPHIEAILPMKFNDLTKEYDEEGIPYGESLPSQADFKGLKIFVDGLSCKHLIVHCWEGTSRSAAVALAVYEYRGRCDELKTQQRFAPNRLVYALSCRELGIRNAGINDFMVNSLKVDFGRMEGLSG